MKNILILAAIFLWCGTALPAQDLKQEILGVQKRYETLDKISADLSVQVYEDSELVQDQKGTLRKENSLFYYRIDNLEMLVNEEFLIMANHFDQSLLVSKVDKEKAKEMQALNEPLNLDSAIATCDSVLFAGETNGVRHYVIFEGKKDISMTDLFIDAKTQIIKEIIYHYNPKVYGLGHYAVVRFNNINLNPSFSKDTFSESKFITRKGGKYYASQSFASFEVYYQGTEN